MEMSIKVTNWKFDLTPAGLLTIVVHPVGLIYEAGLDVEDLVKEAHSLFLIENGLNPMAFPSLVKMETEVISIITALSNGDDETVGNFTSGGTESIFMALKAARDWARETYPEIKKPEMVVPVTAHPAWNKAAHYLGLKIIMIPVKEVPDGPVMTLIFSPLMVELFQ